MGNSNYIREIRKERNVHKTKKGFYFERVVIFKELGFNIKKDIFFK
jgi:hypothetical protein